MLVQKLDEGLWRWALPHPAWKPEFDKPGGGGWARTVGSVYAEVAGSVVLIDPQLPTVRAQPPPPGLSNSGFHAGCGSTQRHNPSSSF